MSNGRLPSFKLLIGFEAAARLGNYSRAADELCVSQSAISHQIGQLEQQLGQVLFRRKGRGVELTVAGRLLQDSVVRSLDLLRTGLGRIDAYLDVNLVTLVCPAHVAHGWLQPRLPALLRDQPSLCPIVSVDESARYIDQTDVDIAITRQPLHQSGVHEELLLTDEQIVVCSPAVATGLSGADPASHPASVGAMFLESDLTGELTAPLIRQRFGGFRRVAIYDDPRLLLDAAIRGRGIALLSRLLADDAIASSELVQLPGYPVTTSGTIWIARTEGELRSPLVRTVFEGLLRLSRAS
jgi:DNA-binding transcriptional LysR family regulator